MSAPPGVNEKERIPLRAQSPCPELTFPYEHSVHVEAVYVEGKSERVTTTEDFPSHRQMVEGSPRFIAVLTPRLPFSESSAGPPITSLRPGGVYCTKRLGRWLPMRAGSPTNVRCKAPHLIKIILAYSPKKKRADPIEDESEVQQDHFRPPSHGAVRGRYRSYSSQPASSGISSTIYIEETEWKCG